MSYVLNRGWGCPQTWVNTFEESIRWTDFIGFSIWKWGRLDGFRTCDTRSLEGIVSIMGPLLLQSESRVLNKAAGPTI